MWFDLQIFQRPIANDSRILERTKRQNLINFAQRNRQNLVEQLLRRGLLPAIQPIVADGAHTARRRFGAQRQRRSELAFGALQFVFGILRRHRRVDRVLSNLPLLLLANGEVVPEHLQKAKISEDEVRQKLRLAGVRSYDDVAAVIGPGLR